MDVAQNRFAWGMALVWLPELPLLRFILIAFSQFSTAKTVGLGAFAGGWSEAYLGFPKFGIVLTIVVEVVAIVLLAGTFSRDHWIRVIFNVVSIGWAGLMTIVYGFALWFFAVKLPQMYG